MRMDLRTSRIFVRRHLAICLTLVLASAACGDGVGDEPAVTESPLSPASVDGGMTRKEGEELETRLNTTDLTIKIESEPARVLAGERPVYTITVANEGPNPSTSTLVTAGTTGSVWVDFPNSCRASGPQRLQCELGELGAGATTTVVLTAQTESTEGAISITGTVENRQGPDSNGQDNLATFTTPVGD
jgi:hypothetical protein